MQAKLKIGPVDDPLEREADRVAERLVGGSAAEAASLSPAAPGQVQRKVRRLRRRHPRRPAGGRPRSGHALPASERAFFEPRLGRDLGAVRLHREAPSAVGLGARAFTIGRDIAFAPGEWRPGTPEGPPALAHELAHVVQQESPARPSSSAGPTPSTSKPRR
ncbi:MAG: DUF4157 domain-containing protein [Geminicoccaceae bacterium]